MAKKSLTVKNEHRVRMARKFYNRRKALLAVVHDRSSSMEERFAAQLSLQKLPRNSSPGRVRNRCAFTGRSRGYYRKFKLSRIVVRELANEGLLPGMTKSSW